MRLLRGVFFASLLAVCLVVPGYAEPFSVFPKAGRLLSPDGRFEVRDVAPESLAGELVGASHSLWLTELSSGRSRKLCDYLGLAAVAWSSNNFLVVTQYVSKKTSRALVFAATSSAEPVLLDGSGLIQMVSVELRPALRENDHVFVEASRLEEETFYFRVWGYGKHDLNGFRWNCRYSLAEGSVSCAPAN
ncbi:MAG TPA: hypothetical protein VMG82_03710 [Candidatus Sulfotelmatobacter sp.]|nr:hypothetical protein [Candidatus Sulfotelmatobacter sp.]